MRDTHSLSPGVSPFSHAWLLLWSGPMVRHGSPPLLTSRQDPTPSAGSGVHWQGIDLPGVGDVSCGRVLNPLSPPYLMYCELDTI